MPIPVDCTANTPISPHIHFPSVLPFPNQCPNQTEAIHPDNIIRRFEVKISSNYTRYSFVKRNQIYHPFSLNICTYIIFIGYDSFASSCYPWLSFHFHLHHRFTPFQSINITFIDLNKIFSHFHLYFPCDIKFSLFFFICEPYQHFLSFRKIIFLLHLFHFFASYFSSKSEIINNQGKIM